MFAQVYLATRAPRRFTFFDYKIPKNLTLNVGDVVLVPFRGRTLLAVVKKLTKTTEVKHTKYITNVIEKTFFSQEDIKRIEQIAKHYIQSPCTFFALILNNYKPTTDTEIYQEPANISIPKTLAPLLKQVHHASLEKQGSLFIQTTLEGTLGVIHLTASQYKNQILVLVPRERDAELLAQLLPIKSLASLHGSTTISQKRSIMNAWRSGALRVLISTRIGTLLPAQTIDAVIITDVASEDYSYQRRNPRFDARTAAKLIAKQHSARCIHIGYTKLLLPYQNNISTETSSTIVNLANPAQQSGQLFLTNTLLAQITTCLNNKKKILLTYNRKGVARRLQCQDCGHVPFCGTCGSLPTIGQNDLVCPHCDAQMWIPTSCPMCQSERLKSKGIGNKTIKKQLQKQFPSANVTIIDKDNPSTQTGDITLVTNYFFTSVYRPQRYHFSLMADLCADHSLSHDINGQMYLKNSLHRLELLAHQQQAACIIQTWTPTNIRTILGKQFYTQELQQRKTYHLPPYTIRIQLSTTKSSDHQYIDSICAKLEKSVIWQKYDDSYELLTNPDDFEILKHQLINLPDSVIIEVV